MEDDRRVWPVGPGPRRRRPPKAPNPVWDEEEPDADWLSRLPDDDDEAWNPQIRRTAALGIERDDARPSWKSLPPSARLYGAPADPGLPRRARGRVWRRRLAALLALLAASALVTAVVVTVQRLAEPRPETGRLLHDSLAGVSIPLPAGWRQDAVPPVTGFTSVARDEAGSLVMARPVALDDARQDTVEAAELYSRLLLKGDRVSVVEDRELSQGHTRALRAEYQDVVNRPAYLRVILLTRGERAVLLVGLLQPEESARRQVLDGLMASVR
ncbi:hypothetical protein [Nonomuraea cavernae]|uniref:Uncharacterized protein n=1 Tax=Nonomuraea cavernae TaxID=2045107 RepID=A0A918DNF1_9ACTN|nr:hypothetical protein [Nonomuraea cavernae]MCA2188257.1 hypothetical protein [Nonomuraea cavernae]GGO73844.1 hypothetical protein GCM10012289_45120 [Nonomuraea cavernae]